MTDPWTLGVNVATILVPPVTVVAVYLTYRFQLKTLAEQNRTASVNQLRAHELQIRALATTQRRAAHADVMNSLWKLMKASRAWARTIALYTETVKGPGMSSNFTREDFARVCSETEWTRALLDLPPGLKLGDVASVTEPDWYRFGSTLVDEVRGLCAQAYYRARDDVLRASAAADLSGAPNAIYDSILGARSSLSVHEDGTAVAEDEGADTLGALHAMLHNDLENLSGP